MTTLIIGSDVPVDIIAILESGINYAYRLFNSYWVKEQPRLVRYCPVLNHDVFRFGKHADGNVSDLRLDKSYTALTELIDLDLYPDIGEHEKEEIGNAMTKYVKNNIANGLTKKTLLENPRTRFIDPPDISRTALLVDEYYNTGTTMTTSIQAMFKVGYTNVFFVSEAISDHCQFRKSEIVKGIDISDKIDRNAHTDEQTYANIELLRNCYERFIYKTASACPIRIISK